MPSVSLKAHYDGHTIKLDEPFDLPTNARLMVTVLPPLQATSGSDREDWANASLADLSRAYGDDEPEYVAGLSRSDARLELACALYSRGRIGKVAGAELAGVDFFAFQRALGERGIPNTTDSMLSGELASLTDMFPT